MYKKKKDFFNTYIINNLLSNKHKINNNIDIINLINLTNIVNIITPILTSFINIEQKNYEMLEKNCYISFEKNTFIEKFINIINLTIDHSTINNSNIDYSGIGEI